MPCQNVRKKYKPAAVDQSNPMNPKFSKMLEKIL